MGMFLSALDVLLDTHAHRETCKLFRRLQETPNDEALLALGDRRRHTSTGPAVPLSGRSCSPDHLEHLATALISIWPGMLIITAGRIFGQVIVVHTVSLENERLAWNASSLPVTDGQFSQQAGSDLCFLHGIVAHSIIY